MPYFKSWKTTEKKSLINNMSNFNKNRLLWFGCLQILCYCTREVIRFQFPAFVPLGPSYRLMKAEFLLCVAWIRIYATLSGLWSLTAVSKQNNEGFVGFFLPGDVLKMCFSLCVSFCQCTHRSVSRHPPTHTHRSEEGVGSWGCTVAVFCVLPSLWMWSLGVGTWTLVFMITQRALLTTEPSRFFLKRGFTLLRPWPARSPLCSLVWLQTFVSLLF